MPDWKNDENLKQLAKTAETTCLKMKTNPAIGANCNRGGFQWATSEAITSLVMENMLSEGESRAFQQESLDRVRKYVFSGNFRNLHLQKSHLAAFHFPGRTGEPEIDGRTLPSEAVAIIGNRLSEMKSALSLDLDILADLTNYMFLASAISGRAVGLWPTRVQKACRWLDVFRIAPRNLMATSA